MAKVRDILVHVCIEIAEKKRRCSRNKEHVISRGEQCLVVRGEMSHSQKNYCVACAPAMLALASAKLATLQQGLVSGVIQP